MSGLPPPFKPSTVEQANSEFATGQKNFSNGNADAALTWFRRAALTDPQFFSAHVQIGLLCRDKAKFDKMFQRYVYDAFLKAAALDLTSEEVHNQLIVAASSSGRLDDVLISYEKWLATNPDNPLLLQCKKNVTTLAMAMIPQSVELNDGGDGLKRFVLVSSILLFTVGFGILIATPMLIKSGKLDKKNARGMAPIGMTMAGLGLAGFISRRYL
jgi:tetratricopeptide (TPR) repeat protein